MKLTILTKTFVGLVLGIAAAAALHTYQDHWRAWFGGAHARSQPGANARIAVERKNGEVVVALSEWPGHMPLVIANGGLETQPGSLAEAQGLKLRIEFIEDPAKKTQALQTGAVDAIWTTVDELPISLGGFRAANVPVKAFLQIDWSRGGDACVAAPEVKSVEDIHGRKSAMLLFSPDHTVFEFMLTNSRLSKDQVARVRRDTTFSPDDYAYARKLFAERKVDIACLWEPDVTLAIMSRPGSRRLFSTADASELVADVLLARADFLERKPALAEAIAKTWFAGVSKAAADPAAAARFVASAVPRFRDELGWERTQKAFEWVKWSDIHDNVAFFGLEDEAPAFDRVYNHADMIWMNYPEAKITDRFAPVTLRDDSIVRRVWEGAGKPSPIRVQRYEQATALTGAPILTRPISINFPTGGAELDADAMATLNTTILPQLQIARGMYIRVEGNTDSLGPEPSNHKLADRRAHAIVEYLVSRGIERERIVARSNGSSRPVASNKTSEGRAANRRTDVLFIPARRPA